MTDEKIQKIAYTILAVLFGCTAALILVIVLLKSCFPHVLNYYHVINALLPNPVLMLLGTLFIVSIYLLYHIVNKHTQPFKKRKLSERGIVLITGTVFFVLQMYFVYNYCFETDWDAQVLLDSARSLANGQRPNHNSWYYSNYPNNIFLTLLFAVILWITKPLHLGTLDFLPIVAVQSLLSILTSMMLYLIIVRRWQRRDIAWLGMTLYILLVGLSPWVSIPYSDSWGLLFPTAVLWAYYCNAFDKKPFLKWFLIALLAYIGFKIKPQVLFIFLSIIIIEGIAAVLHREKWPLKDLLRSRGLCGACVGLAAAFVITWGITATRPIPYDHHNRFGAPHYLMMGMNLEHYGTYNDEDVTFSRQFSTPKERDKANLQESMRRIHEMGPDGLGQLFCEKTLLNYYDGTFSWGKEGNFYKTVFPERNRHLSPFLRKIYYNREYQSDYYSYWHTCATAVWFGVLVFMFFAAIGQQNRFTAALMLSILLLTLYEALFEARARYLYPYVPFYILLALQGLQNSENILNRLKR